MTPSASRLPSTWQVSFAVARVAFSEILRDRILYNIGVVTLLLLAVTGVAAQISPTVTGRILADFAWGAMLLSCFAIALTQGASAIGRELERRTLLVALSKPIHRLQWLVGKFIGIAAVLTLNWGLLFAATLVLSRVLLGEDFWLTPLGTRLGAAALLLVQSWVIAALALFFSSFSTTSLAAVLTVGLYFVGSSASQVRWLAVQSGDSVLRSVLNGLVLGLPNFELFQLSRYLTYSLPVEWGMIAGRVTYGLFWCALLILVGGQFLQRREL